MEPLIRRSLRYLAENTPLSFERLRGTLEPRIISLEIDEESVYVAADGQGIRLSKKAPKGRPTVFVSTSKRTILAVIDGEQSLLEALDRDLFIRGALSDLAAGLDALGHYVGGAARDAAQIPLLEELRCERRKETAVDGRP